MSGASGAPIESRRAFHEPDRLRAGRRALSEPPKRDQTEPQARSCSVDGAARWGISVPSSRHDHHGLWRPSAAWAFRRLEPAQTRGTSPDHRAHRGRGHTAGRGPARLVPERTVIDYHDDEHHLLPPLTPNPRLGLDWACWRASALAKPSTSSSRQRRRSVDPYRASRRCSQPRFCSPSAKSSNEMTCSLTSNAQATTERRSLKTRGRPPCAAPS